MRRLLGDRVADLVGGHVLAKRYLVTAEPSYRDVLSGCSTATLALQGDALSPDESAAFEHHPLSDDWMTLRRADDRAPVGVLRLGRRHGVSRAAHRARARN